MARSTPHIVGDTLTSRTGSSVQTLLVESAAWFAWLQRARSFAYSSDGATFTARKQQRRSHWYWYAFATRNGKVKSCYLGRSGDLTIARLEEVACQLHPTLATGSMAARVYGARSAKAIVAQQQIEQVLCGGERSGYTLQKAALQDLQKSLEQRLTEQRYLGINDIIALLDVVNQLLATYERERAERTALIEMYRTTLHNRPFPSNEQSGELY